MTTPSSSTASEPLTQTQSQTKSKPNKAAKKHPPLLIPERVKFIKKSDSKKRVFEILSELLTSGQKNVSKNEVFDALIAREKLGNTVLNNGTAVPRASIHIDRPGVALVFLKKGIPLDSPDRKPTRLFLAFLLPEKEIEKYAKVLKKINFTLAKQSIIEDISGHKNPQILIDFFEDIFSSELQTQLDQTKPDQTKPEKVSS